MFKKLLVTTICLLVTSLPLTTYGAVTSGVHRVPASHLPNASQQGPTADAASNATVAGTISLTDPVGLWFPGSTHAISWNYTGYIGNHVKVSLYKGGQVVQELATSLPRGEDGHGVFNWSIPSDITQAENYVIEVKSIERPEIKKYSKLFGIRGNILVQEPGANSDWSPGGSEIIRWHYNAKPGNEVKVTLFKNGTQFLTITPANFIGSDGEGMAAWDIPDNLSLTDSFKIQVQSIEYPFVKGSTVDFRLKSKLTIAQPHEDEVLHYLPESITVSGEAYGCGPTITVSLMKGNRHFEKFMSAIVPVNSHHQYSHTFNSINPGNNVRNIRVRVESTSNAHIYKHAYIKIEYM